MSAALRLSTLLLLPSLGVPSLCAQSAAAFRIDHSPVERAIPYGAHFGPGENSMLPFAIGPNRYMQIFDADSLLSREGMEIRELRFRAACSISWTNMPAGRFECSASLALMPEGHKTGNALPYPSYNVDSWTRKEVIARRWFDLPATGEDIRSLQDFSIRLPFDKGKSFVYDPGKGRSLVLDLIVHAGSGRYPADAVLSPQIRNYYALALPSTTFEGCKTAAGAAPTGLFSDGISPAPAPYARWQLDFSYPVGWTPHFVLFGAQALDLGIPGSSCRLTNDAILISSFMTGSTGAGSLGIPIPDDPGLAMLRLYVQCFALDTSGTTPEISSTRGYCVRLGEYRSWSQQPPPYDTPGVARLWTLAPKPENVARFDHIRQEGLVTQFVYVPVH